MYVLFYHMSCVYVVCVNKKILIKKKKLLGTYVNSQVIANFNLRSRLTSSGDL